MGQELLNVPAEFNNVSDPESYSGARVARMILKSLGNNAVPNPAPLLDYIQSQKKYNDPGENWPFWHVDPGAMQHVLVDFDPRGLAFPGAWRIYTNSGQPAADNQIRYTLSTYKVAAAVLVAAGRHWVCVTGFSFDDATKALTGFYYHDPAYDGGGANAFASVDLWDSAFTQVRGGVKWLGKIVEVGDPDPAGEILPVAQRPIVRPGDRLINAEEAAKLAVEGALGRFGEMPHLRRALDSGRIGRPRLVAREDSRGSYYYLVPVLAGREERVLAVIMVDGLYGDVLGISATEEPYPLWLVDENEARERVSREPIPVYESLDTAADRLVQRMYGRDAGEAEQRLTLRQSVTGALVAYAQPRQYATLRPIEVEISPVLVWDPCSGTSPFRPDYVARTTWHKVYVNTYTGALRTHFDLCQWAPLGA